MAARPPPPAAARARAAQAAARAREVRRLEVLVGSFNNRREGGAQMALDALASVAEVVDAQRDIVNEAAEAVLAHDRASRYEFQSIPLDVVREADPLGISMRYEPRSTLETVAAAVRAAVDDHANTFELHPGTRRYAHAFVTATATDGVGAVAVASTRRHNVTGGAAHRADAVDAMAEEVLASLQFELALYDEERWQLDDFQLTVIVAQIAAGVYHVPEDAPLRRAGFIREYRDPQPISFAVDLAEIRLREREARLAAARRVVVPTRTLRSQVRTTRSGARFGALDPEADPLLEVTVRTLSDRLSNRQLRVSHPEAFCVQIALYDFFECLSEPTPATPEALRYLQHNQARRHSAAADAARRTGLPATRVVATLLARAVANGATPGELEALAHTISLPDLSSAHLDYVFRATGVTAVGFHADDVLATSTLPRRTTGTLPRPVLVHDPQGRFSTGLAVHRLTDDVFVFVVARGTVLNHVMQLRRPQLTFDATAYCRICCETHMRPLPELAFCERCSNRFSVTCVRTHEAKCSGVRCCDGCGMSQSPHHRCVKNFIEPAEENQTLVAPDDAFRTEFPDADTSALFRSARACPETLRTIEQHATMALVTRNISAEDYRVYVYDFETVSPIEDAENPELSRRTASQLAQPVLPVVFCAVALAARPGESRPRSVTFVGTDCASRGAEWLESEAASLCESGADTDNSLRSLEEPPKKRNKGGRPRKAPPSEPDMGFGGVDMDGRDAAQELYEALKERPPWSLLAVGFNSARFDLPFLLAEHRFGAVTPVNQGSDAFVKSLTTANVRHVDMRLILGGSLSANASSLRTAADPPFGKWYTPFHLFNAFPRSVVERAALGVYEAPSPTLEQWLGGAPPTPDAVLSFQSVPQPSWAPFQWFSAYCRSDCDLLAMVVRNATLKIAHGSGVYVLRETATMASTAALGNRRHAQWDPLFAQCDLAPRMERLVRDGLFGGVCIPFVSTASGNGVALDVVSAYPARCHLEAANGRIPYGAMVNVASVIGSGGSLHSSDFEESAADRAETLQRLRESNRPNTEGLAHLAALIHDPASKVFGWARVAVEVYPTHPVTRRRVIVGCIPIRTPDKVVSYPVGCFFATSSLPTLREMERAQLGRVWHVFEGGYCRDQPPAGGQPFPHTSTMLLEKVLLSGFPAEATTEPARLDYVRRVSEFFATALDGRTLAPGLFRVDKRLALVYKLFINASWGFHVTRPSAASAVLSGSWARELTSPSGVRLFGLPVPVDLPFSKRDLAEMSADPGWATPDGRIQLAGLRRRLKVKLEKRDQRGLQMPKPLIRTPALSLGACIPDAMRSNLLRFVLALDFMGCTVCYTDTDSVKFMLPPCCTWPALRARLRETAFADPWFATLIEGVRIGDLPGDWAAEGRFSAIACFRAKGLSMLSYVDEKKAHAECSDVCELAHTGQTCFTCVACKSALSLSGKEKTVISGIRPGDPGAPGYVDVLRLATAPADADDPPTILIGAQLTFRVSTRPVSGTRGALPNGMVMVTGEKEYRPTAGVGVTGQPASRTAASSSARATAAWEGARGDAARTWPPLVSMRRVPGTTGCIWAAGCAEYVFSCAVFEAADALEPWRFPGCAEGLAEAELRRAGEASRRPHPSATQR